MYLNRNHIMSLKPAWTEHNTKNIESETCMD